SCFAGLFLVISIFVGTFPVIDYIRERYVYHVPLAILATGFAILAALSLGCGLILDTLVRYEREHFLLRMRAFGKRTP
ncbi:MAG: glycosyl transferase, partial [Chthoniobacter sp.]